MYKMTILGSGAAPGVPAVGSGWGNCDPSVVENRRTRTTSCLEYKNTRILIDTSPDLRQQLLTSGIRNVDGIVYTHAHADHLHEIDELREINRAENRSLNFYATAETAATIRERFPYLIATPGHANDVSREPSLVANTIEYYRPFMLKDLKITPIRLLGHNMPTTGYVFNDGEIVYIADYRKIDEAAFDCITRPVKLLILPLTTPEGGCHHAGLGDILRDAERIAPLRVVINHMAVECDYREIDRLTPQNVTPAFDNMSIVLDEGE